MNKSLEALEELCSRCYVESEKCSCHARYKGSECYISCEYKEQIKQDLERLEKLEKTIEILKDKSVDIVCLQLCFKHYNVEYYNNELSNYLPYFMVVKCQLTQEEYNLLKEVLSNEK